jgi:hypothetical protein
MKTGDLSLLFLLLAVSFCFTRCKDNNPEIDPPDHPTVFNLNGKWECIDTTIWIGGLPEYNYRVLTLHEITFEYIIETEKEDSHDHSIITTTKDTVKGVYSIDYPVIKFTPDLQEDYVGEINTNDNDSFYLLDKKWENHSKYTHALIFNRMKE